MNLYTVLYNLPKMGMYCFLNKEDKRIYITWSTELIRSVSRHVSGLINGVHDYRNMQLDCDKLEIEIIETIVDCKDDISVKYQYWVDYYKELGYSFYSTNQITKYRVKTNIQDDVVLVYLIDGSYKKTVIGVFEDMIQANNFVLLVKGMKYISPIYAINDLSKNYYKNHT